LLKKARNVEAGQKAVEELRKTGLSVQFHQLDIENIESIINLAAHIKQTHGGLDVLVNNAAISLGGKNLPIEQDAEQTIRANFTGTLNVCKVLFPLLRSNARVVHISSRAGFLRLIKNKRLREQFSDKSATVEDIERLVRNYLM
jgi:carbonyl reductase 1